MYLFCSECSWSPDEFLNLTRRQLRHLVDAKVSLSERIKKKSGSGSPTGAVGSNKQSLSEAMSKGGKFEPSSMEELVQVATLGKGSGFSVKKRGK